MEKTKVCICNECGIVFSKDYIGEGCPKGINGGCMGEIVEYSEELETELKG